MAIDVNSLQETLCSSFCKTVKVRQTKAGIIVSLPVRDRDGDGFSIYLTELPAGFRLSDAGSTMMRLSYENNLTTLLKGSRGKVFNMIISEADITEDDGELSKEVSADQLIPALFDFTRTMGRISDMALWTTSRVASTFADDLRDAIFSTKIPKELIHEDYVLENIPMAENYPIDFYIKASKPLYIFGASNDAQLKLVTIILQHLKAHAGNFDSLVVLSDSTALPRKGVDRLMLAANDIVPNVHNTEAIHEKILHRAACF